MDPASHLTVAEHLSTCQSCAQTHARFCEQSASIRSVAPYYHAPAHLQQSIREALRQAAATETAATGKRAPWRWVAIAASILLVVSVSWNLRRPQAQSAGKDLIAESILSDHIRSLIGTHLLDVPSTDQHTVKPWFNGKLDFSPDVKDFASQGFPLIGGRLDYLTGEPWPHWCIAGASISSISLHGLPTHLLLMRATFHVTATTWSTGHIGQ